MKVMIVVRAIGLFLIISSIGGERIRYNTGRPGLRFHGHGTRDGSAGLWPSVFNVATKATITANATCGERGREEFCRLADSGKGRCGICDANNPDSNKRHPIQNAIDGTNRWWQSPSLLSGQEYERVAITLDLKQVYQVVYVIVKAGNSPRPGTWILERSIDGYNFHPWQYYVSNDADCMKLHGIPATPGKPHYVTDTDIICTSFYSKLMPLENGEIHTSLINGRPGANETSPELLEFTKARYVRLLLLKHRASQPDFGLRWHYNRQGSLSKKLYYSIKDISIGGQCVCSGHASSCRHNVASGHPECECQHHTCGPNCDRCCSMYNQTAWGPGTSRDPRPCEKCQCHGHAAQCIYDEAVEAARLSIDTLGRRRGGGVCVDCKDFTTGVNCEQCLPGYYRPTDMRPDDPRPCVACDCDNHGSIGNCLREPEHKSGLCVCRQGYTGDRCDKCAEGYESFPNCIKCQCDPRGSISENECGDKCSCKGNVEGDKCDICKAGHFNLQLENSLGCSECYCSGVSSICEPASLIYRTFETLENWLVCDVSVQQTIRPILDTDTNWLSVGNYDVPGANTYYWLAPKPYLGNKIETYGSHIAFSINWFVMRGDTSGKPVMGPNIILIGSNGLRIAYGDDIFTVTNITIKVKMTEENWYHIPLDIKDVDTYLYKTDYKRMPVNRGQFLSILTDLKHILLRAKFHEDQIECVLQSTVLSIGSEDNSLSSHVEKCSCPSGYTGLSCEMCDYGYVRIFKNVSTYSEQGICVKCNCNGHSEFCDSNTENCKCEHNTIGENCERCAPGYYGNPLKGTSTDCKRCACPLLEESNNFSPSCQLDVLENGDENYVCTQCPAGYTGDHCDVCDYGYFGIPTIPGGKCEPCVCNGVPCDRTTGQCLNCRGNTEGWHCEKCKPQHYGDPVVANCQPCTCDQLGSYGPDCDPLTGQCECKERFTGRTCDRCEVNYGNVTAECPSCSCHSVGAISNVCDQVTGLCHCKPGIEGFHCDACQHLHYGFSDIGCHSCGCHMKGSELATCDIVTGQCRCKLNVVGRKCDSCQHGYWGIESGKGCVQCDCDKIGSVDNVCDANTGQCPCKPGIGGKKCDNCLEGYYGFSEHGCKECKICNITGHICDPDIGKCVCPPHTRGDYCELCMPNTWGYQAGKGCKACNCAVAGSVKKQCNIESGKCQCKQGFTGVHCDRCAAGHYGYPHCHRCDCYPPGTNPEHCDSTGICNCSPTGQCACKENVIGQRCNQCSNGTFGLSKDNPDGCTKCFCFGRTTDCKEANFTLGHIHLNTSRELILKYSFDEPIYNNIPYASSTTQSYSREIILDHDLFVVPGVYDYTQTIKFHHYLSSPLYWRLPKQFLGDKVLSYGGYLRFVTETIGGNKVLLPNRFPLVQLRGNNKIILEYYEPLSKNGAHKNRYEIRIDENLWKWKDQPNKLVSRDLLMVALQKVQHILIRANNLLDFNKAILHSVTLDTAISLPGSPQPLAKGVELCLCPKEYNSSSCQNPSIGFYRWYNPQPVGSIIIDLTGEAKPCQCNGRSNICDIETGHCLNCTENTFGSNCQYCSQGYYGNPMTGRCKPCPCPTPEKKFSQKCTLLSSGDFKCFCRKGYTGPKCDKCEFAYYGNPKKVDGKCLPCNCNKYGSISAGCHHETGQCECRPGIYGKDCSKCESPRHVLESNGCTPCDNCAQWLLNELDKMSENFNEIYTDYMTADRVFELYKIVEKYENNSIVLDNKLNDYIFIQDKVRQLSLKPYEELHKLTLALKREHVFGKVKKLNNQIDVIKNKAEQIMNNLEKIYESIERTIEDLDNSGTEHIEVKNALIEGEKELEVIRTIQVPKNNLNKVKNYCSDLMNFVKHIKENSYLNPKDIKQDIDYYRKRLNDIKKYINKTTNHVHDVDKHSENLDKRIIIVKDNIKLIEEMQEEIEELENIQEDLNYSNDMLLETTKNYNNLINSIDTFEDLLNRVDEKVSESDKSHELRKVLKKAKEHADMLVKLAHDYNQELNVQHEANLAIKASKAYQDIIDLLNEAKELTKEANLTIDTRLQELQNEELSINDTVEKYMNYSDTIMTKAQKLQHLINKLDEQKELLNISISDIKATLWKTGLKQTDIDRNLYNNITIDKRNILDVIHNAIAISSRMSDIHKNSNNIKNNIQNMLVPELSKLRKGGDEILSLGEEKLTEAERNIKSSKDILTSLESNSYMRKESLKTWNDTLSGKLYELKNLILKAKLTADGIRLSLANKENLPCYRSYKLNYYGPTTTTSIGFTLTLTTTDETSTLLYIPTEAKDFLKVELVKKKLQFLWNLGSDTGKIVAPLKHIADNNTLYRVEIERIANVAKMIIYNDANKNNPQVYYGTTSSKSTIFDIGPNDKLWIGQNRSNDIFVTNVGLAGCLHDVVLDGKPIGLWNFISSSSSCTACQNAQDLFKSGDNYYFNGLGYSVTTRDKKYLYRSSQTSIYFNFKTYDEDALLFLVLDVVNNRSASLSLKNGKIHLHIEYSGGSVLQLTTKEKYNIGAWTAVTAGREFHQKRGENVILQVNEENIRGAPAKPTTRNSFPNLDKSKFYIGGVPPEFHSLSNGITRNLHTHSSLLGCMSLLDVDGHLYSPFSNESYGIEHSCTNKSIKITGFEGNGYVQMPGLTFNEGSSLGFVFQTTQENTLLMSGFKDITYDISEERESYLISVVSGYVKIKLKNSNRQIILSSNTTLNDGHYHVLSLNKNDKHLELYIDDILNDKKIDSNNMDICEYVYFGGLPEEVKMLLGADALKFENLKGTIKDVLYKNRFVSFSELINFEKAKIGRSGPILVSGTKLEVSTLMMPTNQNAAKISCGRIPGYTLEQGAVKFGDSPNSHVQFGFKSNNFWHKEFSISFEFRTFYLNGLLFVSPGLRQKNYHFIMVTLKDNNIQLIMKGKRKKEIILYKKYNDGEWHHLIVKSVNRKITLSLDKSDAHGHIKISKKFNLANMIYVGGIAANTTQIPEFFLNKIHPFRGCIKNLKVNNQRQDIAGEKMHNVGQCFSHVETGSYFAGDAYAVYKQKFLLKSHLELQFEFRTSEQNGILLSVAELNNKNSLSLELYNGAVVMMGNTENKVWPKVKTNFSTEFALCDNKWHKVSALYTEEEMTVNVDGVVQSSLALNATTIRNKIESPLYIGGLPENAPSGKLHTRENFKGCIRNVVIDQKIVDWTDMDQLNHILLNSCPVIHS